MCGREDGRGRARESSHYSSAKNDGHMKISRWSLGGWTGGKRRQSHEKSEMGSKLFATEKKYLVGEGEGRGQSEVIRNL